MAEHPLLRDLPPPARREVEAALDRVEVARGACLYRQGEPAWAVWWLASGRVRLERRRGGRVRPVGLALPGDLVGEGCLVGEAHYLETARVAEDGVAWRLSREDYEGLAVRWPLLRLNLLRVLSGKLRERMEELEWCSFASLQGRLAAYLVRLCEREGRAELPLSHRALACLARTSRESATRGLRRLARRGLLRQRYGRVEVLQPERLSDLVGLEG